MLLQIKAASQQEGSGFEAYKHHSVWSSNGLLSLSSSFCVGFFWFPPTVYSILDNKDTPGTPL